MKGFIEVTEEIEEDGFSGSRKVLININSISSIDNKCITISLRDYYDSSCEKYLYNGARIFLTVARTLPTVDSSLCCLTEPENHTVNYIECLETMEEVKYLIGLAQR